MSAKGWLTRERILEVIRFCAVGLTVFGIDAGSLILFRSQTGMPLWLDTTIAYIIASLVNFLGSRQWVFEQASEGAAPRTAMIRYVIVVVIGLLITAPAVPALSNLGIDYRIAKTVVSALIGVGNYFVFPAWVFKR